VRLSDQPGAPDPAQPWDSLVVAAAAPALAHVRCVTTPSEHVAAALRAAGLTAAIAALDDIEPGSIDAIALLDDELSAAGEHGEGLIATCVTMLRPGGTLAVSAVGALAGTDDRSGFRSDELERALGHHGIDLALVCGPGAAARVRGAPAQHDPDLDRLPGLLDAAPRLVAVGRTATSSAARSRAFFGTLPRKVVAAAVVCMDDDGRLLVVHDTFKREWVIPGGVVDAHEDPRRAAVREAWEEAGVRVAAAEVAGVFSASWPDRIVLLYRARPDGPVAAGHRPVHAHEIDDVAWLPVDEALRLLAPLVAEQVRHCLDHPGGTLRQR
jgi:8-oxo-dGTP pyrophosphatase MutT (NUDIX family)